MNPEILKLSMEIAELRAKINVDQVNYTSAISLKREKERAIQEEMGRIRAEAEANLLRLANSKKDIMDELNRTHKELSMTQEEIEEKNKLYAQLLNAQSESQFLEELKKTLDEICADFESYFKAHVYQHEDITAIIGAYQKGLNGMLNANDMGLGKTYESAVTLYIMSKLFEQEHARKPKILWLTKASLIQSDSSMKEIREWWSCMIMSTKKAKTLKDREFHIEMYISLGADILLTNYEFVRTTPMAKEITWDFVVIDEVHKLKGGANSKPTEIWTAVKDTCLKARFIMMLSGTPMVNKPEEMWAYLHIFAPERFPTMRAFERDFVSLRNIAGEMKMAVDPDKLLRGALKGQMIRRRRDEVGLQLPEITREFVDLEMNKEQAETYQMMRKNFFVWLDQSQTKPLTAMAIIAQLTRLRQINVWPSGIKFKDPETEQEFALDVKDSSKIDECMDLIENEQDQVVVFSTFNEPLYEVQNRCRKMDLTCEVISGKTGDNDFENEFQQQKIDVLCINSAMGEGLNLQKNPDRWPGGSSLGIFLDWWWNPSRQEQGEARIHRQGATKAVRIKTLINNNSVDQFILGINADKAAAFHDIMESNEIRPASDWKQFLEGII